MSKSMGLRLFKEGGIYTFGLFVLRAGNFLLIPLYLKLLEPTDYGAFGVVKQLVNVLVILAVASQGHALLRLGVDAEKDRSGLAQLVGTILTSVVVAGLLLAGATALAWPLFGERLDGVPFWPVGAAGLMAVTGMAVFQLILSWLQFQRKARRHTTLNILRWVLLLVCILIFVAGLGWKAEGILAAMAVSFTLGSLLGMKDLPAGTRVGIDLPTLKGSLVYGLPLLPHALSGVIFQATDQVLLAAHPDHGLRSAGVYLLAAQLASGVFMFAMGMQKAWTPFFLRADRDRNEQSGGWGQVRVLSFFTVSMVGCVAVGFGLLAPELVALAGAFGDGQYASAATIVPILVFGAFTRSYYLVSTSVVLANKGVARFLAAATLPAAALNIVLNTLWIPTMGMAGAAWATVTSYLFAMVSMGVMAQIARPVPFKYGRAAALFFLVGGVLWLGEGERLLLRLLLIGVFGVALLILDGRDIAAAVRSLRRKAVPS